ncbi:hypothetical protein [Paraburkholderia domus]|uniref:hypothetical protein n=1 Tax=Paraburkholderia domus TaxID=2793075 RepID=UPI001913501E|nr:hypothetical protein [Paraburkholderia domus]MBK5065706.1 hypothetical protein [Burkholderia sp. R-70199]CAE6961987.1 hypothetical protein R70199_07388 [Paraburkholderia domus]
MKLKIGHIPNLWPLPTAFTTITISTTLSYQWRSGSYQAHSPVQPLPFTRITNHVHFDARKPRASNDPQSLNVCKRSKASNKHLKRPSRL